MSRPNKHEKEKQLSPRMEEFLESVIEEVEEAGIDDEYADDDPKTPGSTHVAQSTVYPRRTRR